MIEKFEVGKKYRYKNTFQFYDCLFITPSGKAVMKSIVKNSSEFLTDATVDYSEYVEPKKGTVWVNVYDYGCGTPACHLTRGAADLYAGKNRLACVEVPWVEGQGLDKCACLNKGRCEC